MAERPYLETVEEQAALYVLGALPAAEAAPFEQRLNAGCPLCCAEVRSCEQVASGLTLSAPEVAAPPDIRARLLESISDAGQRAGFSPMGEGRIVRPADTDWEPAPMPGVQIRKLHEKSTFLVRMSPKSYLPEHPHRAAEQCLVLEGSITGDGITAYAGDFTYMPKGSKHSQLYSETGCLLLIAYA